MASELLLENEAVIVEQGVGQFPLYEVETYRIAIFADSHGRDMADLVRVCGPVVLDMVRPGLRASRAAEELWDRAGSLQDFMPTTVICHFGHNDFAYCPRWNPHPLLITEVADLVDEVMNDLRGLVPEAKIIYSAPFPRVPNNVLGFLDT